MAEPMPPAAQRPQGPRRNKKTRIALAVLAVLIALPVIAVIVILTFDWNRARPWINDKVSNAIDRPFAIRGDLTVSWERPAARMAPAERTWRDHIPWPYLVARNTTVGNPAGMEAGNMASVGQFSFSLDPLALLDKRIGIPLLRFDAPRIDLLRLDPTTNNWTFKRNEQPSRWNLDLERVVLTDGVIHVKDAVTKADVTARVRTLERDPVYGVAFSLDGTYNGAKVNGGGKLGSVFSLKNETAPYPIQGEFRSGKTRIAIEGTVTNPAQLAALDVQLELAGASMARLYQFTGVLLPETPAFSTAGRLTGRLGKGASSWVYDGFSGKVGASDIGGRLAYATGGARPVLSGNVRSRQLVFADLAPLVGADSNASKAARGVEAKQPTGKVLPVEEFHTERWTALDADVRFAADNIVRDKALPISKLSSHIKMDNGVLRLDPLEFGMAGGTVRSTIRLDGSGRSGKNAIQAMADVRARKIGIKQLFPKIEQMQATAGQINADAKLSATGNSVASLLAKSNGELKALVSEGTVSKMLLEMAGLNVANIVVTKLFGDKQVELNCVAADFAVSDGVARTRSFIVDTEEAIITVDGAINLAGEQMELRIRPETKALRIFSLRAPLYVRGSFSKPDVVIDKGVLAMKAGGAAALAVVAAPLAALLPLINTGPGEDSDCARLLAQARQAPSAPPPGRRQRR